MKSNKTMKPLLSLLFLCLSFAAFAQPTQAQLGIHYRYYSKGEIADTLGTTRFKGTEIGHSEVGLFGSFLTPLGSKTALMHTFDYTLYQFSYQNWNVNEDQALRPEQLHALNYQLGIYQKIGTSWQILLDLKPGMATSFQKERTSSDYIFQGALQLRKYFREDQSSWIGVGVTYNTLLGEYAWLPSLAVFWQNASKQWSLDVNFPFNGTFTYSPAEKLKLGVIGRVTGNQFNFISPVADNFRLNATHGGALLSYHLFERVWLQAEGGLIINRTYEAYEGDRNRSDFDPAKLTPFYVQLQIIRTLKTKDKE